MRVKVEAMPRKGERLQVPAIGEYYQDLLTIDAVINDRTVVVQAQSLLCSKLQEREARIKERVQYLADKRNLSFKEMWDQLLTGIYEPLSPQEYLALLETQKKEESQP